MDNEKDSKKPWYKKWWGILVVVGLYPVTVPYLIWTKTKWKKLTKQIVIGVVWLPIIANLLGSSMEKVPVIVITAPENQSIVMEDSIEIEGHVDPQSSTVTINERMAVVDGNGNFVGVAFLEEGSNSITIIAEGKYNSDSTTLRVTRELTEEEQIAKEEQRAAEAAQAAEEDATDDGLSAGSCAKNEVEQNLKSPSTADFPWFIEGVPLGDNQYMVSSYVDAQNAFGVEIRTSFVCYVTMLGDYSSSCIAECIFE